MAAAADQRPRANAVVPPSRSPRRRPRADADEAAATIDRRAVLLFYCYARLDDDQRPLLADWYRFQCASKGLYGRVRVARDGVNATLGGDATALRALIAAHASSSLPPDRIASIDWKLQLCDEDETGGSQSADFCAEKGVRVRVVEELVTFGSADAVPGPLPPTRLAVPGLRTLDPRTRSLAELPGWVDFNERLDGNDDAASFSSFPTHLTPRQFHAFLLAARRNGGRDPCTGEPVVLLDARNAYETALGRFAVPGVRTLDPRTRSLAELPGWVDFNERLLARHTVLAYCTGGVRCERAAAMLRSRGIGFSRVAQLEGGIQRYLEAREAAAGEGDGGGAGGFFEGVNFVFDGRGHVGPSPSAGVVAGAREEEEDDDNAKKPTVVGRCAACGEGGASYSARRRCARCRMLLPLCAGCCGDDGGGKEETPPPVCALCVERRLLAAQAAPSLVQRPLLRRRRPLRILCLHGFRSTAKMLKARLRPLERALMGVAELVFVDAPHALPLWYRPRSSSSGNDGGSNNNNKPLTLPPPFPKRAWLASARVLAAAEAARRSGAPPRWEPAPAWIDEEEEEEEEYDASRGDSSSSIRPRGAAALQDCGWAESVAAIARAAAAEAGGAFDGALGVSQGAAVLAGLLALRQQQDGEDVDERAACAAVGRFAVLISGFAPAAPRPFAALEKAVALSSSSSSSSSSSASLLQVPSLHVFPTDADDDKKSSGHAACVPGRVSWALARAVFEPSKRAVMRLGRRGSSGGGGGGRGGGSEGGAAMAAAAAVVAPSERGKGGGAQLLPVTPARIARVRQFLLSCEHFADEAEDDDDERGGLG